MKRRKKRKKPKADESFSNMRIYIPYLLETKGMGFFCGDEKMGIVSLQNAWLLACFAERSATRWLKFTLRALQGGYVSKEETKGTILLAFF